MGCEICNIELTENDLFFCGSCENVRRKWEVYCEENNFYKKRREYKLVGRKKKWK
jgi:hypothetical protein